MKNYTIKRNDAFNVLSQIAKLDAEHLAERLITRIKALDLLNEKFAGMSIYNIARATGRTQTELQEQLFFKNELTDESRDFLKSVFFLEIHTLTDIQVQEIVKEIPISTIYLNWDGDSGSAQTEIEPEVTISRGDYMFRCKAYVSQDTRTISGDWETPDETEVLREDKDVELLDCYFEGDEVSIPANQLDLILNEVEQTIELQ